MGIYILTKRYTITKGHYINKVEQMRGERGQTSIEFLIILSAFLVMALAVLPFVIRNAELSKGVAAARDGATYGIGMLNLGYKPPGYSGALPARPYKLHNVDYTVSGTDVTLTCTIDGTDDEDLDDEVQRQMLRFVYKSINGDWPATDPTSVTGGTYTFDTEDCTFE